MKIKSITFIGEEPVYNMEVDRFHNFAVNGGVIVHNCDSIRYLLSNRPAPTNPGATYYSDDEDDDDIDLKGGYFDS